jgi:hypothetical protein
MPFCLSPLIFLFSLFPQSGGLFLCFIFFAAELKKGESRG